MISIRRIFKIYIGLAVIALSIFIGLNKSGIMDIIKNNKKTGYNFKEELKKFDKATNFSKIEMAFSAADYNEINKKIQQGIGKEDIIVLSKKAHGAGAYSMLLEVPDSISFNAISYLQNLKGYVNENVIHEQKDLDIDIDAHIANKESAKAHYEKLRSESSYSARIANINEKIFVLQTELDSLRSVNKNFVHDKTYTYLFIKILIDASSSTSLPRKLYVFAITTLVWAAILTAILFVALLAMSFILKLMSIAGIKSSRDGGGYGGGYYRRGAYNYGGYNYGKKRKVKRVYKNKEDSQDSDQK